MTEQEHHALIYGLTHRGLGLSPPTDLPADPQDFWRPAMDWEAQRAPSDPYDVPALQRLGPPPFPKAGFPLMGFLATLYHHTAQYARDVQAAQGRADAEEADRAGGSD